MTQQQSGAREGAVTAVILSLVVVFVITVCIGLVTGYKVWHRGQIRADANNRVKVTAINIRNAQQQAKVVAASTPFLLDLWSVVALDETVEG